MIPYHFGVNFQCETLQTEDSQLNDQYVAFFYGVISDRSEGIHLLAQREPFLVETSQQIQQNRRFLTHNSLLKSRTI